MLLLQINNNLRHPDEMSWNHVSMCILNGGGIRSPIDERNNGMLPAPGLSSACSLSDQSPKTPPPAPCQALRSLESVPHLKGAHRLVCSWMHLLTEGAASLTGTKV